MSRIRVKICGITRSDDVAMVAQAGADAIGFVFFAKSPRHVEIDQAVSLIQNVPPFIVSVGLFLNPEGDYVREVIQRTSVDMLQFHGTESASFCESFERPYIKAVPMGGDQPPSVKDYVGEHPGSRGFLLDSNAYGEAGGSGKTFDWHRYPSDVDRPLILAGGLGPDNVAEAAQTLKPYGVDVSSGVESAPGEKDAVKVRQFIEQVEGIAP